MAVNDLGFIPSEAVSSALLFFALNLSPYDSSDADDSNVPFAVFTYAISIVRMMPFVFSLYGVSLNAFFIFSNTSCILASNG